MKTRLVITGMGAVTPIGIGVPEYWHNLIAGKCGIDYISRFDTTKLPVRIAAEIRNFDGSAFLPRTVLRASAPFIQYAYAAAEEALTQSGLHTSPNRDRIGVCMGTAMAGVEEICQKTIEYESSNTGKISPHFVPKVLGNMAAAHFAITHGFRGPSFTNTTACSAGGDALMLAAMLLLSAEADAFIVMGGENILTPTVISSLAQAKALSRQNAHPQIASRPFDINRDGFVIGEGGGAIVLETEEHAIKRNASIHAILAGWGNTMDAHHITAPEPSGEGASSCMRSALRKANLKPEDIDYINAHGTSTQLGDRAETIALKNVFGTEVPPPISSTKGATGHLMGAGGLTELIACIKAIEDNVIPPTLNLHDPDPFCDLDYVPNHARKHKIDVAMSNSLGFGGQNSSIIVRRHKITGRDYD